MLIGGVAMWKHRHHLCRAYRPRIQLWTWLRTAEISRRLPNEKDEMSSGLQIKGPVNVPPREEAKEKQEATAGSPLVKVLRLPGWGVWGASPWGRDLSWTSVMWLVGPQT